MIADGTQKNVVIGATSKLGIFICRYPWRVVFILIILGEIVTFDIDNIAQSLLKPIVIVLPLLVSITFAMQIFTRKWCYRIEISISEKIIIFYLLFNRGVVSLNLNKIKIVIGSYCNIMIDEAEFIIHAHYIHDLVAYLPKDTIVEYQGRIGRYKQKAWNSYGRSLIPGSKL